jgi:hypothetical protein
LELPADLGSAVAALFVAGAALFVVGYLYWPFAVVDETAVVGA